MTKKNLLTVTEDEWKYVKEFLKKQKDKDPTKKIFKIRRKNNMHKKHLNHSFIVVEDKLYAIANGEYLGKGGFGRVKIAQAENGDNYAIKVEMANKHAKSNEELDILKKLGNLIGVAIRIRNNVTYDKILKKQIKDKKYTLQTLLPGKDLQKTLKLFKEDKAFVDLDFFKLKKETQKLIMACKIAESVKILHDQNIVHLDLKPHNILIDVQNNNIVVISTIDYGLSKMLKHADETLHLPLLGSKKYMLQFAKINEVREGINAKYKAEKSVQAKLNTRLNQLNTISLKKLNLTESEAKKEFIYLKKNIPIANQAVDKAKFYKDNILARYKKLMLSYSGKKFYYNKKNDVHALGRIFKSKLKLDLNEYPIISKMLNDEHKKIPNIEKVLAKLRKHLLDLDPQAAIDYKIDKRIELQ